MKYMALSFLLVALLMGAWIILTAAPQVTMLQRLLLAAICPIVSMFLVFITPDT